MKACTTCAAVKLLDEFNRHSSQPDGRKSQCRACQSAYNAARYASNPEAFKASARAYEAANRPIVLERKKHYYQQNRERLLAQFAEHCKTNRAARSSYRRAYAKANPSKEREWAKAYRLRNLDLVAARVALREARKLRATPPWADRGGHPGDLFQGEKPVEKNGGEVARRPHRSAPVTCRLRPPL